MSTKKRVLSRKFDYSGDFSKGFALVGIGDQASRKFGYIDKTGKYVIEPQFDHAREFAEGIALIEIAGKYGYVDKVGKYICNPQRAAKHLHVVVRSPSDRYARTFY